MLKKYGEILRKVKLIVTIIIIMGVLIHLLLVYNTAKSIEIKNKKIVAIYPKYLPNEYEIKFILALHNPKNTEIEVDYLNYKVYVENEFAGYGEKPRFIVKHGVHNYTFTFSFDVSVLSSVSQALLLNGNEIDIRIKGELIIPAKFLGLFTWRYIKLPYEINEKVKILES